MTKAECQEALSPRASARWPWKASASLNLASCVPHLPLPCPGSAHGSDLGSPKSFDHEAK